MTDYDNTNTGIMSRNERREKDTHPEFTGSINVEGREYWLNGWVKTRKDGSGRKFFSLSVKPKDGDDARTIERFKTAAKDNFGADEIPF